MTRLGLAAMGRYEDLVPAMSGWIDATLGAYRSARRPVSELGFERLPQYFSTDLLMHIGVMPVAQVPIPPLSSWGLAEFASFERQPGAAITFRDTYFIDAQDRNEESLHCHELVHAIQWEALGERDFLLAYARELADHGYEENFFEQIAYDHQARFDSNCTPYDIEAEVREQIAAYMQSRRDW